MYYNSSYFYSIYMCMLLHLVLYPMRKVTNNITSELLTHFPGLNTDSLQGGIWHFTDLPCGGSVYYDVLKVLYDICYGSIINRWIILK
jgi:hypothetical protein